MKKWRTLECCMLWSCSYLYINKEKHYVQLCMQIESHHTQTDAIGISYVMVVFLQLQQLNFNANRIQTTFLVVGMQRFKAEAQLTI